MKKTLEQVNKHFAERILYHVDSMDWLDSRSLSWTRGKLDNTLRLVTIPNWLKRRGVTNKVVFQVIPPHLNKQRNW